MLPDRRIHARKQGVDIVRYDKAGKWYVEIAADYGRRGLPAERKPVKIREAALHARGLIARGATHHAGIPGGQAFDRLVAGRAVFGGTTQQ